MSSAQIGAVVWRIFGIYLLFSSLAELFGLFLQLRQTPGIVGMVRVAAPAIGFWMLFWLFSQVLLGIALMRYSRRIGEITCRGL